MYTSISLPNSDMISQDEDGFVTHHKTYTKNIPATSKDTTRSDETLAKQMGYSVSKVFTLDKSVYTGQGYLIDESDNLVYDIKRVYHKEKSHLVELTCEVRSDGKI